MSETLASNPEMSAVRLALAGLCPQESPIGKAHIWHEKNLENRHRKDPSSEPFFPQVWLSWTWDIWDPRCFKNRKSLARETTTGYNRWFVTHCFCVGISVEALRVWTLWCRRAKEKHLREEPKRTAESSRGWRAIEKSSRRTLRRRDR